MNYLAHLFLAQNSPESQLGNILGDFVKGSLGKYTNIYSPEILQGIQQHRFIDIFTDTHNIYRQTKRRIVQNQGHLSGIASDIYYDHFLSVHWSHFSSLNRLNFIDDFYQILQQSQEMLPRKLKFIYPRLIQENWLASYFDLEAIDVTLQRISRRFKRDNNLKFAGQDLRDNYQEIEQDFLSFFPELITYNQTL